MLFWLQNEDFFWKWMVISIFSSLIIFKQNVLKLIFFKDSVLDEKINENFKNKAKTNENDEFLVEKKCLNYDSELDKVIVDNLNRINSAEAEFEQVAEELNAQQSKLKKSVSYSKEELEAYAVKNLEELKAYESDLKSKLAKAFDSKPISLAVRDLNDEPIKDLMELIFDESDKRFILQKKNASDKKNSEFTVKKQIDILQKDYENLKSLFEKEQESVLKECETIAERLKDCHIVSNSK